MKNKCFLSTMKASVLSLGVLMAMTLTFQSCKEEVDDSAFAIKTDLMIADYLVEHPEFSYIADIFSRTPLSPFAEGKGDASPIMSALSARGNYTVFAPTNDAVMSFVKQQGHTSVSELTAEEEKLLAYSCVIDNGSEPAYESADFPDEGTFPVPDLNDRLIKCTLNTETNTYVLNENSIVTELNIDLGNGYMHVVGGSAIAPSNKSIADLIKAAGNMSGMAYLLELTGWDELMSIEVADIDKEYELLDLEESETVPGVAGRYTIPQHRYLGYTGFVEPDAVFESELGVSVTDKEGFLKAIVKLAESAYGTAARGDFKNPDNAVNRFVAYHFVDAKMSYDKLVRHFNESGYMYRDWKFPQTETLSVDVWDYYVTAGKHRALLKILQDGDAPQRATSHNIYLNRVSTYEVENYGTTGPGAINEGVLVQSTNMDANGNTLANDGKNGSYYPINKILIDDQATQTALGSERIRFDATTILPELLSNNIRGNKYHSFPRGYFSNILNESADTKVLYLNVAYNPSGDKGWRDYQGDEMMAEGLFDFVLRLPPVPADGTYELRFGVSHNTLRGMAQIYVGESPTNLQPAGQPYDMRQAVRGNDNIGFVEEPDGTDDATKAENDKNMHNHGYMKAPRYFMLPDGTGASTEARNVDPGSAVMRRIITTQQFEKGKTYYLRFKSALEQTDAQFFIDYFEFCPSRVYNGTTPEDQW